MKVALVHNPTIRGSLAWAQKAQAVLGGEIRTDPGDADRVVVFGGDGSVHAVANARPGVEIAIVPCGSGNDFLKTFGIPLDPEAAIRVAASGRPRPVDVVEYEVQGRRGRFVNIAQIGFGARVVAHATKMKPFTGRRTSYALGILTALLGHRLEPVAVEIDGKRVGEYLLTNVILANGQYFGSGMHPMPAAVPDDGLLDVAVMNEIGRWKIVTQKGMLRVGLPRDHQKIHHFRAREVRVLSDRPVLCEADGEVLGNIPAVFKVISNGFRVICPIE